MGVSYNRLWKMLIDKNMTIEKICKKLVCTVDEMMEFTDEK